jgi:hypothetical protein
MGLLTGTDRAYYAGSQQETGLSSFDIENFSASISTVDDIYVYLNNELLSTSDYSWSSPTISITGVTVNSNDTILVILKEHVYGGYRHISLADLVNNFMFSYVGDGKIINRAKRRDVLFHAKRALQEFSYDISKVEKIQEVEVGPSLSIPMPRDYVSVVAVSYVDDNGIEHPIPRGRVTSKPSQSIAQDSDANYQFNGNDLIETSSVTDSRFKNFDASNMSGAYDGSDDFFSEDYSADRLLEAGKRYGGEPELMNSNGMYIIDEKVGTINFSSNINGLIVTIKYVSDSLGTDEEMKVHKFAEEAVYKHVAHAILSTMSQVPEYVVNRFKREKRSAMRNAKLRLYEISIPELTQVMRGKSKQLKH